MADNKVEVVLTAKNEASAAFNTATADLRAMTSAFSSSQAILAGVAGGIGGALVTAAYSVKQFVAHLAEIPAQTARAANAMGEMADRIGINASALSRWGNIAEANGTSLEAMAISMRTLSRTAVEDSEAFAKIGVATRDAHGNVRDLNALFRDTISGLHNVGNSTERLALAMQLLGRSALDMGRFYAMSREEMAMWEAASDSLGATMSPGLVEAASRWDDAMDLNRMKMQGLKNMITEDLLPAMTKLIETANGLPVPGAPGTGAWPRAAPGIDTSQVPSISLGGIGGGWPSGLTIGGGPPGEMFGPTPFDLYTSGQISREQYEAMIAGRPVGGGIRPSASSVPFLPMPVDIPGSSAGAPWADWRIPMGTGGGSTAMTPNFYPGNVVGGDAATAALAGDGGAGIKDLQSATLSLSGSFKELTGGALSGFKMALVESSLTLLATLGGGNKAGLPGQFAQFGGAAVRALLHFGNEGYVPMMAGASYGRDSVPAMLTPGEAVVRPGSEFARQVAGGTNVNVYVSGSNTYMDRLRLAIDAREALRSTAYTGVMVPT